MPEAVRVKSAAHAAELAKSLGWRIRNEAGKTVLVPPPKAEPAPKPVQAAPAEPAAREAMQAVLELGHQMVLALARLEVALAAQTEAMIAVAERPDPQAPPVERPRAAGFVVEVAQRGRDGEANRYTITPIKE